MSYTVHTPTQLGHVLSGHRKTKKLTQREVAAQVGLLPKTISGLETAPERCNIRNLFKLLSALDLEIVLRPKDSVSGKNKAAEW